MSCRHRICGKPWKTRTGHADSSASSTGSRLATAERVIYYAIIDARTSSDEPAGVLRRIVHGGGQRDEAFGHDLAWRHTFLLYSAERGCLDNTLHQISGGEADNIVQRIRGRRPPAGRAGLPFQVSATASAHASYS